MVADHLVSTILSLPSSQIHEGMSDPLLSRKQLQIATQINAFELYCD